MPDLDCPQPNLHPNAQGIARVAVDDTAARLIVTFERPLTAQQRVYLLNPRSYSLTGGQRIFPRILRAELPAASPPDPFNQNVVLTLDQEGDFSIYTLTVSGPDIDPFFSSHKLRFRLDCDDLFDCRPPVPQAPLQPELNVAIDYLAKDYASFRQALLDFIPTRLPEWTERSEADIGMMLLELFAATADTLSYMQDRVANEAFLSSATQRRSVAEHLALIGYEMDQGAAAYTWLQFLVSSTFTLPVDPGFQVSNLPLRDDETLIIFETMQAVTLRPAHNRMELYTWDNRQCCLPRDSLSAALKGSYQDLQAGDYLMFDDGQGQRDVVRLTEKPQIVPVPQFASPPASPPAGMITLVTWSAATPLRYDYCADDTFARGNLVLATHGETITDEPLRRLTPEQKAAVNAEAAARKPWQRIPRQRLRLQFAPLAYIDTSTLALAASLPQSQDDVPPPSIIARTQRSAGTLTIEVEGTPGFWQEQASLLDSQPDDQVFRVEIDDQGDATVVFGDNTFGLRPDEAANVSATYRVGGGTIGNVAADTLLLARPRLSQSLDWFLAVTNPLPATGGRNLESRDHARRFGPQTFKKPLVAVTATDYQSAAQNFTDVLGQKPIQRANADFRWTGSWLTVTLAVDPKGAETLDARLRRALLAYLDTRRLAGYDLEITRALYLPIEMVIEFCVGQGLVPGDVRQTLVQTFSTGELPNGEKGFFHPDRFSFGDNLYISQIYAACMSVPGVESAEITRLARLHAAQPDRETQQNLRQGYLASAPDQIIRLDNDRNFPENGILTVKAKGVLL